MAKNSNRDEFTEKTKRILAKRVGYRCSIPDCDIETCGPCHDTTRFYNVGVASHITAASPGFARYDEKLTSEERKHPDNGIWMCQTHGKQIDDDAVAYPTDYLKQIKRDAEARALRRLREQSMDGDQKPFLQMSTPERYGLEAMADLADGRSIPAAIIFDMNGNGLTFFAEIGYMLRFLIAKIPDAKQVTLFKIVATVYAHYPLPEYRPSCYALPQQVYPFFVLLKPPVDGRARPCTADFYCSPNDERPVPAVPLTLTEEAPEVIDLRFNASEAGIYEFALDVVIMNGMDRYTFRAADREIVLFEPPFVPED